MSVKLECSSPDHPRLVLPIDLNPDNASHTFSSLVILTLGLAFIGAMIAVQIDEDSDWSYLVGMSIGFIVGAALLGRQLWRFWRKYRSARKHLSALISNEDQAIELICNHGSPGHASANVLACKPKRLARLFIASGHCGFVIRLGAKGVIFRPAVNPIQMQFEPLALNEASSEFIDFLKDIDGSRNDIRASDDLFSTLWRQIRRWNRFGEAQKLVFLLILCIFLSRAGWEFQLFVAVLMGVLVFLRFSPGFVVPSGIFFRAKKLFFRRADSIVIWIPRDHTVLFMSNDGRKHNIKATPKEAELLFRAWYSPAQSPSIEMLQSFFGRE